MRRCLVLLPPLVLFLGSLCLTAQQPSRAASTQHSFSNHERSFFIANHQSQKTGKRLIAQPDVLAFVQTPQGRVLFSTDGAFIAAAHAEKTTIAGDQNQTVVFKAGFAKQQGAKRARSPRLAAPTGGVANFLKGAQADWQTGLPMYQKLVYDQVWDGISVEYYAAATPLALRVVVEPHADPDLIRLETGAHLVLSEHGVLTARRAGATLSFNQPTAYQIIDGRRVSVGAAYRLADAGTFGFQIGAADPAHALYIEPDLTWSTYLGGDGGVGLQQGNDLAVDSDGHTYITGVTPSADFPTTAGVFGQQASGFNDVFVTKLDSSGSALVYATYLGGAADDVGHGIAVDSAGQAVIAGTTHSTNFPTTSGALDQSHGGMADSFICKLNASGTALLFATFLGGDEADQATALVLDQNDDIYVTGFTESTNFPTTAGAFQTNSRSLSAFIAKLNASGSALSYATFLGGSNTDWANDIAIDGNGNAYIVGATNSQNFPTTEDAFQRWYDSVFGSIAFVAKLNPTGSALIYATYLGSRYDDVAFGVAVDSSGRAFVVGTTDSSGFPTTDGAYAPTMSGWSDAFVTSLSADGGDLVYSTFLGDEYDEIAYDITLDAAGQAVVTGTSSSQFFPTTAGAFDAHGNGGYDVFVSRLNATGSELLMSTLVGGAGDESGRAVAVNTDGVVTITGTTASVDFPTTETAVDRTLKAPQMAFVTRLPATGATLEFSTLLGGSGPDEGTDIVLDDDGNSYLLGRTFSPSFPTTGGVYDPVYNGNWDVFVAKMDPTGGNLLYATYLGGAQDDRPIALARDATNHLYITGVTLSPTFPTTPGVLTETLSETQDVFLSKLDPNGQTLVYSTFLGTRGTYYLRDLAVGSDGTAHILAEVRTEGFPVTSGSFDPTYNGGNDCVVNKLNANATSLVYGTYLGTYSYDSAAALALDAQDNAYILGITDSYEFPTTPGCYSDTLQDSEDLFVTKLNPTGTTLLYSTLIGGEGLDWAHDIAVDNEGAAYLTGWTSSESFPITEGAHDSALFSADAFVTKLNSTGSDLVFSTYLGMYGADVGTEIAVAADQYVVVAGNTDGGSFPITDNAFDSSPSRNRDAFVARFNPTGTELTYATFLGGSERNEIHGLALDSSGNAVVVGSTDSPDFPTTAGSYNPVTTTRGNAFVTKLCLDLPAKPQEIIGPTNICAGPTPIEYRVPNGDGVLGYQWRVPEDATIISGQGTNQVSIVFASATGELAVAAENACGLGQSRVLTVTGGSVPDQPATVNGPDTLCAGDQAQSFSIMPVDGATNYRWTVPADAVITAGQGATTISVTFGETGGIISVVAENDCGAGPSQTKHVILGQAPELTLRQDGNACAGAAVTYAVVVRGAVQPTYQWFKDQAALTGETGPSLHFATVTAADEGTYHCEVVATCGAASTAAVNLIVDGLQQATLTPISQSLGRQTPVFTADFACAVANPRFEWRTVPPTDISADAGTLRLEPAPTETTLVEVTVFDDAAGRQATAHAWLLVAAHPGYEDFNQDGCNTVADLQELAAFWREPYAGDPNDDGLINVLDLLYLKIDPPESCP